MDEKIRVAVFASGNGTNAQNIAEYFKDNPRVEICRIYSDKPNARVLERASSLGIATFVFSRKELSDSDIVLKKLEEDKASFIVLAGFLLKIPDNILEAFPGKIVNIHPALLPKYGGKGMYGMHVHRAVKASGDDRSGITIHFVNSNYDEGNIIFQAWVPVEENDSPEDIAQKVHRLEYRHFPKVIEELLFTAETDQNKQR